MALKVHIPLVLYIIPDRRKRIFFGGGGDLFCWRAFYAPVLDIY